MKTKKMLIVALPISILAAGALYTVYLRPATQNIPTAPTDQEMASDLQKRGMDLAKKNYYAPLVATYEQMVALAPDSVDAKKKLALAYFGAGNYDKAQPLFETVAQSDLMDAECWYELAEIVFSKGDSQLASQHLQKALALDPQHSESIALKAKLP